MLALCHSEERSTRKGYAASVRQQSCQRLRSDVGIRISRPLAPLLKADSPYQGEMSQRDKRDRASCQRS